MGSATAQYAHSPVPEHLTVPGWRVGLIIASFSVALPAFLNGAQTGMALGFWQAALAAFLAGLILCAIGCVTSVISVRTRLTTYMLVQRSFGRIGAGLVNIVIAFVLFGWFGVNIYFFGNAMVAAVAQLYGVQGDFATYVIAGSVLISVSTIFGFQTLNKLAVVAVPLLGIILAAVCFSAIRKHGIVTAPSPSPPVPMGFGIALSALVGGNMLTVATMPDISRYVRTTRGALLGMILSFPLATPLLVIAASLPALAANETDIMTLIVALGFGVPALAALILSTWVINAANLYSVGLSLSATFPAVRSWVFVLLGGAVGTAFCLMGIVDAFVPFLLFLGLITPPIAAVYVIDSYTLFRDADTEASLRDISAIRWPAVATWGGSVLLALGAAYAGLTLTGVPTLDATILAAVAYASFLKWRRAAPRAALPADV